MNMVAYLLMYFQVLLLKAVYPTNNQKLTIKRILICFKPLVFFQKPVILQSGFTPSGLWLKVDASCGQNDPRKR